MMTKYSKTAILFVSINLALIPHGVYAATEGFLTQETSIQSDTLLPPPPSFDSIEFLADKAAYDLTLPLQGTKRWEQARQDANLDMDNLGKPFSDALGIPISQENTPEIFNLLLNLKYDAGVYGPNAAKEKYQRMRPFMYFKSVTCQPEEEDVLRKNGSYPSGHTAIGWATALVLSEIRPERTDVLLKRGFDFGQSRVICRAHWQSDVNEGRVVGAAQLARLHTNPEFVAQLQKAKDEAAAILAHQEN